MQPQIINRSENQGSEGVIFMITTPGESPHQTVRGSCAAGCSTRAPRARPGRAHPAASPSTSTSPYSARSTAMWRSPPGGMDRTTARHTARHRQTQSPMSSKRILFILTTCNGRIYMHTYICYMHTCICVSVCVYPIRLRGVPPRSLWWT